MPTVVFLAMGFKLTTYAFLSHHFLYNMNDHKLKNKVLLDCFTPCFPQARDPLFTLHPVTQDHNPPLCCPQSSPATTLPHWPHFSCPSMNHHLLPFLTSCPHSSIPATLPTSGPTQYFRLSKAMWPHLLSR